MNPIYAMVDCNNFYASCERLFRPDLHSTPIVVLSNNDGCVIARSNEAKLMGVKMGTPTHKIDKAFIDNGLELFSSNYTLYGDISARVMRTLRTTGADMEVYSIDEAFLNIAKCGVSDNLIGFGRDVRAMVARCNGLPVCVGIAPTKTLAKLANNAAKNSKSGILDLSDPSKQTLLLNDTSVSDVWGIGTQMTKNLQEYGITTAKQLRDAPVGQMRKRFSVVIERTVRELRGEPCIPLEVDAPAKKEILCSRSFGSRLTTKAEVATAISNHAERAGRKLRKQNRVASEISISVHTNKYSVGDKQNTIRNSTLLQTPTSDTGRIVATVNELLEESWDSGFRYHKAGVVLRELSDPDLVQTNLFADNQCVAKTQLMNILDRYNSPGKSNIQFASSILPAYQKDWQMNQKHLSPRYTTRWDDLPIVR